MKKIISIILTAAIMVSAVSVCVFAEDTVIADGITEISKYGNVKINLPHDVVFAHFEFGDIVTVSFGNVSLDVPLCIAFSDVDSGKAGLFCQNDDGIEETELAVNMGNFAEAYGIAVKKTSPDKTFVWEYRSGFSAATQFTITLKEKAGYLEQFTVRNLTDSDNREDYPTLSDAQFANFRMVNAGRIKDGILYRSSSPVDPTRKRNTCADAICRENGITHFINLGDSEAYLTDYEGYAQSYYATVNHIAVEAGMDPAAEENKAKFAACFRYIIANPDGRFDVHCREGKERAGMFTAITECLMGASYKEIAADYMTSYCNYYGIKEGDNAYTVLENSNFRKTLAAVFGVDPQTADLEKEAEEYLADIGLSFKEIISLRQILSGESVVLVLARAVVTRIFRFIREIGQTVKDFLAKA